MFSTPRAPHMGTRQSARLRETTQRRPGGGGGGVAQVLERNDTYTITRGSQVPDHCINELARTDSAHMGARVDARGWMVLVSNSVLHLWSLSSKTNAGVDLSLEGMGEACHRNAAQRVSLIFNAHSSQQTPELIGAVFVASSGLVRAWLHLDHPEQAIGARVQLQGHEQVATLSRIEVQGCLLLLCGTSSGALSLLSLQKAPSGGMCFEVSEVPQPQAGLLYGLGSSMSRMLGWGGGSADVQQDPAIVATAALTDVAPSDSRSGLSFVLARSSLSLVRVGPSQSEYVWQDALKSLRDEFLNQELSFLDLALTSDQLLVLFLAGSTFHIAIYLHSCDEPGDPPRLNDIINLDVQEDNDADLTRLQLAITEHMMLYVVRPGSVLMTALPAREGRRRTQRRVSAFDLPRTLCCGSGTHGSSCWLLCKSGEVLCAKLHDAQAAPAAGNNPATPQAALAAGPSAESQGSPAGEPDLDAAFKAFCKDRQQEASRMLEPFRGSSLGARSRAVAALVARLVDSRPNTNWENKEQDEGSVVLSHFLRLKDQKIQKLMHFLPLLAHHAGGDNLWGALNNAAQRAVLECAEKSAAAFFLREIISRPGPAAAAGAGGGDFARLRENMIRGIMQRSTEGSPLLAEGCSMAEIFYTQASAIAKVFGALDRTDSSATLTGFLNTQAGSVQEQAAGVLAANELVKTVLCEAVSRRNNHSELAKAALASQVPWTLAPPVRAVLLGHLHTITECIRASAAATPRGVASEPLARALFDDLCVITEVLLHQHETSSASPAADFLDDKNSAMELLFEAICGVPESVNRVWEIAKRFHQYTILIRMIEEERRSGRSEGECDNMLFAHLNEFGENFARVLFDAYCGAGRVRDVLLLAENENRGPQYDQWLGLYLEQHNMQQAWLHHAKINQLPKCANVLRDVALRSEGLADSTTMLSLCKLTLLADGEGEKAASSPLNEINDCLHLATIQEWAASDSPGVKAAAPDARVLAPGELIESLCHRGIGFASREYGMAAELASQQTPQPQQLRFAEGKWISFIFAVEVWMLRCAGADGADAQLQSIWKHVLEADHARWGELLEAWSNTVASDSWAEAFADMAAFRIAQRHWLVPDETLYGALVAALDQLDEPMRKPLRQLVEQGRASPTDRN